MRGRLLSLVLLAGLVTGPALALEEADRSASQSVIERQIEAFRRDDAAGAYSLASPGIRSLFPGEEQFMAMVRNSYPPVYRPRSVTFGDAREVDGGLTRMVLIQDQNGVDWDALYTLTRQADGSWRISGCRLVRRPGDNV